MFKMRLPLVLAGAIAAVSVIGTAAAGGSGGVTGPALYANGELYRTVVTPTDFSHTGAPDHSFDIIYAVGHDQPAVAEAAPGDKDFNGGRWRVVPVMFDDYDAAVAAHDSNGSGDFDSDDEILAAVAAGDATLGDVIASFECPLIRVPRGHGS